MKVQGPTPPNVEIAMIKKTMDNMKQQSQDLMKMMETTSPKNVVTATKVDARV